ncbi:MAG: hypothetical protein AB1894_19445 [Chloroflexota bacterium]
MKKHAPTIILTLVLALTACQAMTSTPANQPATQPVLASTETAPAFDTKPAATTVVHPSATSSPTVTLTPTPAATPTPAIQIDLRRYDFDVNPPIDVSHNPPLIVRMDETVNIEFSFVCKYPPLGPKCPSVVTLYISYGEGGDFTPTALIEGDRDGLRVLSADLSASDESGQPLRRYYLQVTDPQVGLDIRYPTAGAVDLFVASELIPVDLPAQKPVETGELALGLPWGDGPEAVGLRQKRAGYPWRQGPVAMDVADDERIALLDLVKKRILIFDPTEKGFTTIPVSFILLDYPDVQFDRNGQIAVFDPRGEPLGDQSTVDIPRLFRFLPDGHIGAVAPVFVEIPGWLNKDLQVMDWGDMRLVTPFGASGKANSRETQRQKQSPRLTMKYMLTTVNDVRFADWEKGIAFAVHSESMLGAIICFEKTPQGYVAVFEGDQLRAVWFDEAGKVLKDVTLPREDYSEINPFGRTSIMPDGSLYFLRSTENGIEVRFVKAP